jgi:carboxymethylenebutenolidase
MRSKLLSALLAAGTLLTASSPSRALAAGVDSATDYATRMAHEHADDTAAASPATTPEPTRAVTTEEVVYATIDGAAVRGYLAKPAEAAPGNKPLPGILVIQEWWGLNDNIRAMTRRLAGEGYVALAVDLYEGKLATTPEAATAAMQAVLAKPARAVDNLKQAHAYLLKQATRIGVVGWCFGGGWALETALQIPDGIAAAVMYYGRVQTDPTALAKLEAPLLGLFGAKDEGIPVDSVRAMERELVKLGKNATIVIYPDADHAFANPTGTHYLEGPASDAWAKTVAFFAKHLKG